MKNAKLITIATIAVLAVVVVLQNSEPIQTRVLFATIEMSRALLLALTFGAGGLAGLLLGLWLARGRKAGR